MKFLYFSVFFLIFPTNSSSLEVELSTGINRLEFESEYANYSEGTGRISLSTGVVIRQISENDRVLKTIKAEKLEINTSASDIIFNSEFSMEDSSGLVKAGKGVYNYKTSAGEIENGTFYIEKFIFKGRTIRVEEKKYVYKKATITTCAEEEPHYHISAYRISLVPGKRFLAYNTFFYLGKVPVFYFPVIYKPLGGGSPVLSQFYPGYDERSGFFIKSNYIYKFNRHTKLKLFVDYFSKQGFGTGTEIDYFNPKKNITSLAAYRIREYGKSSDRWGLNGGFWHSLRSPDYKPGRDLYAQTYFRLISDPNFNNDYFRANPFAVSSDKQASAALTYKNSHMVARASSHVRYLSTASAGGEFRKSEEVTPRLDFQTVPAQFKYLPFFNAYSGYFENSLENSSYFQKKINANWNISRPVNVYRNISFYPGFFYEQYVHLSTSSAVGDVWTGRYGTDLNLRYSRLWGSVDLQYYTKRRTRENKPGRDKNSADKGIEEEYFSTVFFLINSVRSYMRFTTRYDLKNYLYYAGFKDRLYPLTFELYKQMKGFEFYLSESYSLDEGNKNFITQLNSGDDKNYFNVGLANYGDRKSRYIFSNGIGFVPPIAKDWRMELTLRYWLDFEDELGGLRFYEKAAVLYKDFHDFRTRFNLRIRKDVKEFFFYVTLKMNDPYRRDEIDRRADYFWRPWRKEGEFRE